MLGDSLIVSFISSVMASRRTPIAASAGERDRQKAHQAGSPGGV